MAEIRPIDRSATPASFALGRKLDSIPFSGYHVLIIAILALVGFIEGYDLVLTGSLLVLAKVPLNLTGPDIRWLAVGPTFMLCIGGFASSAISDHWSRKAVMLVGVIATTFCTLLIPLVQSAEQLIIVRLLTGFGAGFAVSAAFPIAAELMPAQHRRTYGAVYEMALAISFTVVPFIAFLLADNPEAFRFLALPGGLAITVVPVLVYFLIPESPRWHLRRGHIQAAADLVNQMIRRSGNRVPPLTVEALGGSERTEPGQLPPLWALFARGQLRWTTVGILSGVCAGTAYFLISVLLPKALVDQGAAVSLSFGLTSLVYFASIPGKAFTGFLMEIIGRRWTIFYALAGSLPGLFLMLMAHRAGDLATVVMVTGALITGFTVLSAFTACRVYLSEQFPTALRGRGQPFGESTGRLFAGVLAPFLMEPHTGSATIFFGTILAVVAIGAFIPVLFGRETVGLLETVTEPVPAPA
ncbi:MAG TPA: MFS transporter [Stellaceae bacterium]|nr:MFS transporter [Stellaceae bacterium]HMD64513.1 MFS transporter [Stellaceae bacterium]